MQHHRQSLYTLNGIYPFAISCVRLSIVFLYRRIFSTQKFHFWSTIAICVITLWWVVFTVFTLVPCIPPQSFWNGNQFTARCYNYDSFFLGIGIVEIILDFVILLMPVRMVLKLQMSARRKALLCFIFLLGAGYVRMMRTPSQDLHCVYYG